MSRRRPTLLIALLDRWVRPTVLDAGPLAEDAERIVYVLQRPSRLDLAALSIAARDAQLPGPERLIAEPRSENGEDPDEEADATLPGCFALSHNEGWLRQRPSMRRRSRTLRRVVGAAQSQAPVRLVPVSVFWGRAPDREGSLFRAIISERWTATSGLRRLLGVLFDRTHLFVRFGTPIEVPAVLEDGSDAAIAERRIGRLLRTSFRRHREALIGPDLSHRRTLVDAVIAARSVRRAAATASTEEGVQVSRVLRRARGYAKEIASDISFPVIRFFDVLLSWLWDRLYDGVNVTGLGPVKEIAGTHTLVYVPSHRSHMDYLLLTYVLFYNGFMLPHIAAGKNLNIPVVGPLLRRSGAFFMRRSFRGDALYAAVFEAYLDRVFASGASVEYFVEGGRSRTGRLLPPRGGMLGMTVRAFLRGTRRPIAFVPIYFGYERVVEARSYLGELRGREKRDESLTGVLRSARVLRQSFGTVHVAFGSPLVLGDALDDHTPTWSEQRGEALAGEAAWFQPFVRELGDAIQRRVNATAVLTPVGLVATALLATEREALDEESLCAQVDCLRSLELRRRGPDSEGVSTLSAAEAIAYCEKLGVIDRQPQALGDLLGLSPVNAVLLTWYRNNVIHLFAVPALLAALLTPQRGRSREDVLEQAGAVLPFLCAELYFGADRRTLAATIEDLAAEGLVRAEGERLIRPARGSAGYGRLDRLARVIRPTLERYFIVVALLEAHEDGAWATNELETACVLTARRMARLSGIDAPEFFDATLFRRFIDVARAQGLLRCDEDGRLHHDGRLRPALRAARRVLDPTFYDGVRATRALPALMPEATTAP